MKHTLSISLLIFSFLFSTAVFSAPVLKVYQVTKVKQGDSLNMRAWPSVKSRVLVALPHNAKWVASNRNPIKKSSSFWQQVHWNGVSGWVNTKYLKFDAASTYKARQRQKHRTKTQGPVSRNTSARRQQPVRRPQTVATRRVGKQVFMECGGSAPFWNISMNFTGKRLKVDLRDGNAFNTPLFYRKWNKANNKMVVNGGRGRNAVRATLTKNNACRDGITNIKYPFSIAATVAGNRKVSGCCRSVQH